MKKKAKRLKKQKNKKTIKKQVKSSGADKESLTFIYCVYPSKIEARAAARLLLEYKLIFCANISAPIISEYLWKSKICRTKEYAVFFKTIESKSKKCREKIESLHSYDVPVVAEFKVKEINEKYLLYVMTELLRN